MCINDDKFEMFSSLSDVFSDSDTDIKQIKEIITAHLINLHTSFNTRFEDFPGKNLRRIRSPFSFNINKINLENLKIKEKHIDLSSEKNLRIRF